MSSDATCAHQLEQEIWKPEQVAKHLRVSSRHVNRMAARGILPARRLGRVWRFDRSEIVKFMQGGKGTR